MKPKLVILAKAAVLVVVFAFVLVEFTAIAAVGTYLSRVVTVPAVQRAPATSGTYPIVGTGQLTYWNSAGEQISAPSKGAEFYGQDAQFPGTAASYRNNGDGTISDQVTELMWTQSPDVNGDGMINTADKLTVEQAIERASTLRVGGHSDWRLPTIKEQYSLINFNGVDPHLNETDTSALTPFIDTKYFTFGFGDTSAGDRIIDAQMPTSTFYVDKTFMVLQTMFGTNFVDGRIKGYPPAIGMNSLAENRFYAYYVRGNPAYGVNSFADNGDGTVTDAATTLMWSRTDSGSGMDWQHALAWAQSKNAENYLGHNDWRVPNIKELQSLVDYSRSPATTNSPAIDPVFETTAITNEAGQEDYGFFWSSTTHLSQGGGAPNVSSGPPTSGASGTPVPGASPSATPNASGNQTTNGEQAAYISFGRGMGTMFGLRMDVHGAGSQRSDPKSGNASDYPDGFGPQGDARRIDNFVRLVRNAP